MQVIMTNTKSGKAFQGLWPAMFTPVFDNGELNPSALEKLIELLIAQKVDGLYLLGSTGQGFLFSEKQRKRIAEVSLEIINKRLPVIVQVGALNTDESVRLARHAAQCGADGISSVGPIYYASSASMAVEHYRKIATSTELPFFPYQIGSAIMNYEVIERLRQIPNIRGMKLTTSNLVDISNIHNRVDHAWKLFSGADELLCHAALCGTSGAIGTSYNLIGRTCKDIRLRFLKGDVQLGIEFMLCLQRVIEQVLPVVWSFFRRAMLLIHHIDIGRPKPPLLFPDLPWTDEEVVAMVEEMESFSKKEHGVNK
jgi:N-acetylneuraminate lyase